MNLLILHFTLDSLTSLSLGNSSHSSAPVPFHPSSPLFSCCVCVLLAVLGHHLLWLSEHEGHQQLRWAGAFPWVQPSAVTSAWGVWGAKSETSNACCQFSQTLEQGQDPARDTVRGREHVQETPGWGGWSQTPGAGAPCGAGRWHHRLKDCLPHSLHEHQQVRASEPPWPWPYSETR